MVNFSPFVNVFVVKRFKGMHETQYFQFKRYAADSALEYKQNAFCLKKIGLCIQEVEPVKQCTLYTSSTWIACQNKQP